MRGACSADLTTLGLLSGAASALFAEFKLGWLFEELRLKLEEERWAHVSLCTSKVLTMEWIDGVKVNDSAALRAARISPRARSAPGNIMVRPKGRRGLLSWLVRGSWQPFEVVLLDHGSYLAISDALRGRYCQLWAALFAGDAPGAAAVAIELGGQRAGQILPVILTQRGRNKQEQREMQRAAGVASFGDITQLLATAPRDVVELLRIAAVVRNVTATLGTSLADRLRINAGWALRGLPPRPDAGAGGGAGDAASEADRRYTAASLRLGLTARLLLIRGYCATAAGLNRALLATLHVFGQPVLLL
ncbi:Adck1 [Scenedesmus sp. PABB004]|nr:Adck1 [Scenedesmus sp. PABB004]